MEKLIFNFLNGDGNGYGYGYGDGNGNGNGDGYGYGYGDGYGYGNGDGNGYGDGDGNGDGYGDGDIKFETYLGKKVYYIDGIPCIFNSIKNEIASVLTISLSDFSTTQMYVAKKDNLFAHGLSVKEAIQAVTDKYYSQQDVEERIKEFRLLFKKGVTYSNEEFFLWHHILTGSCEIGRLHWMRERQVDIKGSMTVEKFISLTKETYGGDVIKRLID